MREKNIQLSSNGQYHPILFDTNKYPSVPKQKTDLFIFRDFMDRDYYTEPDRYETLTIKYMSSIMKHWDNVDFFERKFDELKEKEMSNTLAEFEKKLLYEVVEKRLLEFPNPFLPKDYEKLMSTKGEYKRVVSWFHKKYKKKR